MNLNLKQIIFETLIAVLDRLKVEVNSAYVYVVNGAVHTVRAVYLLETFNSKML